MTSVYDSRDRRWFGWDMLPLVPGQLENSTVVAWWSSAHDELLRRLVEQHGRNWPDSAAHELASLVDELSFQEWLRSDPSFKQSKRTFEVQPGVTLVVQQGGSQRIWQDAIIGFALARAGDRGLFATDATPRPTWRDCPLCGEAFREDSVPGPLVARLSLAQIDFCSPCLTRTLLRGSESDTATRESVLRCINDVAQLTQLVPSQDFPGLNGLVALSTSERASVLRLTAVKPQVNAVKKLFGSWFEALIASGVLEGEARRLSRGTQCLGIDGHGCSSLGEKMIDDTLTQLGVAHSREPACPERNFRADFQVGEVLIEYFGLAGDEAYDVKMSLKRELCRKHGVSLVELVPKDLANRALLEAKLLRGMPVALHTNAIQRRR